MQPCKHKQQQNTIDKDDFFDQLIFLKADKHKTNNLIHKIFNKPSKPTPKLSRYEEDFGCDGLKRRYTVEEADDEDDDYSDIEDQRDEEEEEDDDYEEFGSIDFANATNPQILANHTRAADTINAACKMPAQRSTVTTPKGPKIPIPSSTMHKFLGDLHMAASCLEASTCFKSYHHATWYVSNAKQIAQYFISTFGFKKIAYKGLETGSRGFAGHVIQNGSVIFEFVSPICSGTSQLLNQQGGWILEEMHNFIRKHGDGVKDVSFEVTDVDIVYKNAIRAGAKAICEPRVIRDEFGSIKKATIQVFEDLFHTLIEYQDYTGVYLPNYRAVENNGFIGDVQGSALRYLPPVDLEIIDHCVQNKDWNMMNDGCDVYSKVFGFHKFWSVDEKDVSTEYSALRSMVMASSNEQIKMPINEPADGICKSQIEEFLDFYDGPGVQHIAVTTSNIIDAVRNMKARGAEFITVPQMYYENLLPRLLATGVHIKEDLEQLKELDILIDFDDQGYLLQIFTKPLTDRPTFFLEIIQRHNHNGFGKGNFKALFQTIEQEQRLRGTLEKEDGSKQKISAGDHDMTLEL